MLSFRNVVLGVSGGVDSSVAALLLKNKGFNVIGVFMKNWDLADENGICSLEEDYEDAKYVCNHLKIPFLEVNFVKEYWNEIFNNSVREYEEGFTPNPDVLCNKFIKFGAFFDYAVKNLKADAIATGHYAKTSFGNYLENYRPNTNVKLFIPKDRWKDQTLFLSQVPQKSLRKTMFPLGSLTKDVVKKIAMENGLGKIAKKQESTGICFIGKRKFPEFISEYVPPKPGKFINIMTGKIEGTHDGIHMWTIGQRTRIQTTGPALFVVKKIPETPDIYVVEGTNHPLLFSSIFFTYEPQWVADPPDLSYVGDFDFRFQHSRPVIKCKVFKLNSGNLLCVLEKPLKAITPGQFAVFYKDDECFGSAKISKAGPSYYSLGKTIPADYKEYESFIC